MITTTKSKPSAFRSGWCGLGAQTWQHGHCRGGHDSAAGAWVPCVCDCHDQAPAVVRLVDVLDVPALEQLVDRLGQVLALPGVVPPAAHRLRAAAVELLDELAHAGGTS